MNPIKIINDPVHGFIPIYNALILEIIDHPYFQRLRRIKQLGLTELVYPGATHTRYSHALGALSLMKKALDILIRKGINISDEEYEASQIAILLHDIGHGPLSHTLENKFLPHYSHESVGYMIMKELNKQHHKRLDLALKIFRDAYERKFFNQLVCSQLDVDRLDYLKRDSFYTGVPDGNINIDRILNLLNVSDNRLVIEEKGIYPIENFINARRLMYWQVYLHKTAVAAEKLLENILDRVLYLKEADRIEIDENLYFLMTEQKSEPNERDIVNTFCSLDDNILWSLINKWKSSNDQVLSDLCERMLSRKLPKIELKNSPLIKGEITKIRDAIAHQFNVTRSGARFHFSHGRVINEAYLPDSEGIIVLKKDGSKVDISNAADLPNIKAVSNQVVKYYICYPKEIKIN